MKACIGSMLFGVALGALVCSVYPIPMCRSSKCKIRRAVRHAAKGASDWL